MLFTVLALLLSNSQLVICMISRLCKSTVVEAREDRKRPVNSSSICDDEQVPPECLSSLTHNSVQRESDCSSYSTSDDIGSVEDLLQSDESPECVVSDDEDLFEIALISDGHYVAAKESDVLFIQSPQEMKRELMLPEFLPETVFRQYGLMEILSEISEEDNLIEIDISRGIIKCSTLEMNA
ncbi:hypothetical protein Cni_G07934 [Canna indica]|uniref:Uncharacterized protein n=1 Tax=Canna indica TaxID=4628 RepID=A0AAQ3JZQ6_9LILI|nr:hypothetical protein Cni_G07934 [Canna indica]